MGLQSDVGLLEEFKKFNRFKISGPQSDTSLFGEFRKFNNVCLLCVAAMYFLLHSFTKSSRPTKQAGDRP